MASVILKVADIGRTVEWYVAAGFEVTGRNTDGYFITLTEQG